MNWSPDQKILNRARAINRNLMEIQGYLRLLIGETKLPKNQKFTRRDLKRLQYLNDRQLQQGAKLRKLLELVERKP